MDVCLYIALCVTPQQMSLSLSSYAATTKGFSQQCVISAFMKTVFSPAYIIPTAIHRTKAISINITRLHFTHHLLATC